MKGNNVMVLNEATMIEAVQVWLQKKYPYETPVVTAVAQLSTVGAKGYADCFEVRLAEHGTALA